MSEPQSPQEPPATAAEEPRDHRLLGIRLTAREYQQVRFLLRTLAIIIVFVIIAASIMGVVVGIIY
ncbi:MAG: hypothetical protein OHK0046_16740 [Anaerolineae bacterium]